MSGKVFCRVLAFSERVGRRRTEDAHAVSNGACVVFVDIENVHADDMRDLVRSRWLKARVILPGGGLTNPRRGK